MILPKIVHRPDRDRWEMYFSVNDPSSNTKQVHGWCWNMHEWCWNTFGPNGFITHTHDRHWDYHGGWLYLYKEKYVTMFILRWS
jgi:hypothetical protein